MTSNFQVTDKKVPNHDLAALHHDKLSRLLVALGQGHLGADQAVHFTHTLQVASDQSSLRRRNLFDSSIERFVRPLPIEKGLQKRQGQSAIAESSSKDPIEKDNKQTYASLSHALPEYYEIQNPHCLACSVPLFIGINSHFDPMRRGIVCAACGADTPAGKPESDSKRRLRSMRVRATEKVKAESSDVETHKKVSKKARLEPVEDFVSSSQQNTERDLIHKSESENANSKFNEGTSQSAISLDARMKQKQKKKDKKVSRTTGIIPSTETKEHISPVSNLNNEETMQHSSQSSRIENQTPQLNKSEGPSSSTAQSSKTLPTSKLRRPNHQGDDKQALRSMLAANRKKKEDANKAIGSKTASSTSSGLQKFLDSL